MIRVGEIAFLTGIFSDSRNIFGTYHLEDAGKGF